MLVPVLFLHFSDRRLGRQVGLQASVETRRGRDGACRSRGWWCDSVSENGTSLPFRVGIAGNSNQACAGVPFGASREADERGAFGISERPEGSCDLRQPPVGPSGVIWEVPSSELERILPAGVAGLGSECLSLSRELRQGVSAFGAKVRVGSGQDASRGHAAQPLSRTWPPCA